jgi:hypothetical protein
LNKVFSTPALSLGLDNISNTDPFLQLYMACVLQIFAKFVVISQALDEIAEVAEDDDSPEALETRCFAWYLFSSHWLPPVFKDPLKSRLISLAESERCPFKAMNISDADLTEFHRVAAHWSTPPKRRKFYGSLRRAKEEGARVHEELDSHPGTTPVRVNRSAHSY